MSTPKRLEQLRKAFQSSSFTGMFGIKLHELTSDEVIIAMPVSQWFIVSENQVVQGGITNTLMNWACVFHAMTTIENGHTLLMHSKTRYYKPIKKDADKVMVAKTKILCRKNRLIRVEAKVYNEKGEHKATGKFTYKAPKTP